MKCVSTFVPLFFRGVKKNKLLLLTLLALFLGCADDSRYMHILDRAQEQNQNYDSITGIDSIQMAAEYYDRHGNNNNKVRAYYLLGCAYRDAGEPPQALQAWHDAADRADTTSENCDYVLLMLVHSQSAVLLRNQFLPYDMLDELRAQRRCALLAGDDKNAINALERMNDAFYLLNEPDSVIRYCLRASQLYQQYGFQEEAAQAFGPAIDELVKKGDFEQAKTLIDRYSTSKKHFVNGELIPRKAQHYYTKSQYYIGVGKLDSAEIMLRKLIFHPERTDPQLEAGYRGMLKLYGERLGKTHSFIYVDSLIKYADLYCYQTIPAEMAVNKDHVQQMQALYKFTHMQEQAQKAKDEARQQQTLLLFLALVIIIISLLAIGILKYQQWKRREQRLEYEALQSQYDKEKAELAKAKVDLELAQGLLDKRDPVEKGLMAELEDKIRQHQRKLEVVEKNLGIIIGRPHYEVNVNTPGNQIISEQKNEYHKD